jgi:murein L,D-transpeptidase YcbB/YkuD
VRRRRTPLSLTLLVALGVAAPSPASAAPARAGAAAEGPVADAVTSALRKQAGGALKRFYAERGFRPLWIVDGKIGPAARTLIGYLAFAQLDGLDPSDYRVEPLRAALAQARDGDAEALARAELAFSNSFARFVRDQRKPPKIDVTYADPELKPRTLKPEAVLRAAAFPKSFTDYVANMGWMSPHYVRLRALSERARNQGASRAALDRLALNLDRARLLPSPFVRHVVVDASSGLLWYYEAGKQVGTMRVVVGTQETQTPMLVGSLQWAILNPYWNVPDYLARKSVAPKVLAGRSLASLKMEAFTDWSADARRLPAKEIDWHAVAAGERDVRLRELPGPHNSMGKVKFLFPNDEGIYLHDTPERALLRKDDRHFSNGCIRLEKAAELGRWLLHKPLTAAAQGKSPEQAVPLPVSVPVYLTYLTATATRSGLAFREDVYRRDE